MSQEPVSVAQPTNKSAKTKPHASRKKPLSVGDKGPAPHTVADRGVFPSSRHVPRAAPVRGVVARRAPGQLLSFFLETGPPLTTQRGVSAWQRQ